MPFHVSEVFLEAIHKPTGLVWALNMEEHPIIANSRDTTKIKDLTGGGNHGIITGAVDAIGKFGRARDFDGVDDQIETTSLVIDPAGGDFGAGVMVNADSFAILDADNDLMVIWAQLDGSGSAGRVWFYIRRDSAGVFHLRCNLGGTEISGTTNWATMVGEWHRVDLDYETSTTTLTLYIDGIQEAQAFSVTMEACDGVMRMGRHKSPTAAREEWDGRQDQAQIYNRHRTPAEILTLFQRGSPFIIPGSKIAALTLVEADEDLLDEMTLRVYNDGGEFRDHLGVGNEVKWYMRTEGDAEALLRWTGIVKKPTLANVGDEPQTVDTVLGDYVYEILTQRQLYETFVAKDAGVALKEAVELKCPELDTTLIQSGAVAIDLASDGRRVKDVAFDLARMAGYQLRGDELKRVGFLPAATDDSGLTADYTKVANVQVGPDDTKLANVIRVEGGEGTGLITEQVTQTTLFTVTDSTRKQTKILTPKPKVKEVEIWTDPTGFTGKLIVRIQADDGTGTAPIAVGDPTQDLSRKELDPAFLAVAGFTTFRMPVHILGAGNEYWIITESDGTGAAGQRVGTDGSGNLTFRAHFAYPIIEETEDAASIAQFGRREDHIPDPTIETKEGAKDRAKVEIARRSIAERVARFEIRDPTLLVVRPGQGVVLDLADEGVSVEKFILHERRWRLQGGVVRVTFKTVEQERLLEAADVIKALLTRVERVERRLLRSGGEEVPDIFLQNADSYAYADAATLTVDVVAGMVWDTDAWDLEVWSD